MSDKKRFTLIIASGRIGIMAPNETANSQEVWAWFGKTLKEALQKRRNNPKALRRHIDPANGITWCRGSEPVVVIHKNVTLFEAIFLTNNI